MQQLCNHRAKNNEKWYKKIKRIDISCHFNTSDIGNEKGVMTIYENLIELAEKSLGVIATELTFTTNVNLECRYTCNVMIYY